MNHRILVQSTTTYEKTIKYLMEEGCLIKEN
jgi:hypothetical protein